MINLTRGNLIMTPLSYHSSNLSLITLEAMRLLVLISEKKNNNSRKLYPTFPGWPYCACLYGKFSSRRGGIRQNQVRSYQGRLVHILYEHVLLKKFVKEVEVSLRWATPITADHFHTSSLLLYIFKNSKVWDDIFLCCKSF